MELYEQIHCSKRATFQLWARLRPLTQGLSLFFLVNCIAINLALSVLGQRVTSLDYTRRFVLAEARSDSWDPMRRALEHLHDPGHRLLYSTLFFEEKLKFQYPPTSLLLLEPLRHFPKVDLTSDLALNRMSWFVVVALAMVVARLVALSVRLDLEAARDDHIVERLVRLALALSFTLTFYPIVQSFAVGQIQTWITFFFAVVVWTWMTGHRALAGMVAGLMCVIKPQYSLLLAWGVMRKEWGFVGGLALTVGVLGSLSLKAYGLANHVDYLPVLSFIARHGETPHPNQSMNGLLNRLLFNGNPEWDPFSFAPYNPWVHAGTLATSVLLVAIALFWRRHEHRHAALTDLLIAMLSLTMASPIAWEHHYGIMLPMFAVVVTATTESRLGRSGLATLVVAFALTSNFYMITDQFAATSFNFLQSYLFFAAVALLVHLYRLRKAQNTAVAPMVDAWAFRS